MNHLINDSIDALLVNPNYIQSIFDYMDIGDTLNTKIRLNKYLSSDENILINNLTDLIKSVITTSDIILYRGVQTDRYSTLPIGYPYSARQFTSLTPDISTAKNYGNVILRVKIPAGTSAFYVSAWEYIPDYTTVEHNEEKEVILLPGNLIYDGKTNGFFNFTYEQLY